MSTKSNTQVASIEKQMSHIEAIKSNLLQVKKVQLHPNIEGFESPDSYAIYRPEGGEPIGKNLTEEFVPMDLNIFFDSIVQSLMECCPQIDLSKIEYKEHLNGSLVTFEVPLSENIIVGSKMKGDILGSKLQFKTGFTGKQQNTLGVYTHRVFCSNGCARWDADVNLNWKNTKNSLAKVVTFSDKIVKIIETNEDYIFKLGKLNEVKMTRKQMDAYIEKVFGYDLSDVENMHARSRKVLDAINAAIGIESANTGMNAFSLLQGITRYTTHDLAEGNETNITFQRARMFNDKAQKELFALV